MSKPAEHAAVVSSKGQVVIPGEVRKRLGLQQGSVLRFIVEDGAVRLVAAEGDVRRLKGRLRPPATAVTIEEMNAAVAARRARLGRA